MAKTNIPFRHGFSQWPFQADHFLNIYLFAKVLWSIFWLVGQK